MSYLAGSYWVSRVWNNFEIVSWNFSIKFTVNKWLTINRMQIKNKSKSCKSDQKLFYVWLWFYNMPSELLYRFDVAAQNISIAHTVQILYVLFTISGFKILYRHHGFLCLPSTTLRFTLEGAPTKKNCHSSRKLFFLFVSKFVVFSRWLFTS